MHACMGKVKNDKPSYKSSWFLNSPTNINITLDGILREVKKGGIFIKKSAADA